MRRRARSAAVLVLLGALVAGCSHSTTRASLTVGVAAPEVSDVTTLGRTVGTPIGIYEWYQGWQGSPAFDTATANAAVARGALPMLTWEPEDPDGHGSQPKYSLAHIIDGTYDAYITAFARQIRAWGGVVAVRFLHEVNGDWSPWGIGVNGNTPKEAVQAWDHVRRIFAQVGDSSIIWVWCVNAARPGETSAYASLYPGNDEVDWVAVDGYNGGTALPWGGWTTPEKIFGPSFSELKRLTHHPLIITETGSAEAGGDKAAWIHQLFSLARTDGVRAVIWFNFNKETDWQVGSSAASVAAFRGAVRQDRVSGPLPIPSRISFSALP